MAKKTQANVPAKVSVALPVQAKPAKVETLPVPDGWYDVVIFDVDPEYYPVASPGTFVVLKCKMNGSLRYKDRTFKFFVGEAMEATADGRTFDSARATLLERFGFDPYTQYENYLDLVCRAHIGIGQLRDGKEVNRVISLYPKAAKAQTNEATDDLEQEIPF